MVKCEFCDAESPDTSEFCEKCGKDFDAPRPEDFAKKGKGKKVAKAGKIKPVTASPAKKSKKKLLMIVAAVAAIIIITLAILFLQPFKQGKTCRESWACGDWSACVGGQQTRVCTDSRHCGTFKSQPAISQPCSASGQCGSSGSPCQADADCCGKCVHGVCSETATYCGDSYCDTGETCSSCPSDCGACPVNEQPSDNIFTVPMGMAKDKELKSAGYVIVRYFYSQNCQICSEPADVGKALEGMASSYKDFIVLETIDATKYPFEAKQYASVGGYVYTPTIRVDGISGGQSGYSMLFGLPLEQDLETGKDVASLVAPLICEHSDHCDFSGGKIVRLS